MLRHLTIKDFVIVDRLELEFSTGFGALTGETGAGKSILIDALALALGERADAGVIRSGCDKAEVTAAFDTAALPQVTAWLAANDLDADDELMLRRVVDAGGRSRAYINGSPATVQQLREVSEWLVDIHGQHAHQSLLRSDAQRALLDAHAGLGALVRDVGVAWKAWRESEQLLRTASEGAEALKREREQLQWQIGELDALAFGEDEWATLDVEHRRLGHAASLIAGAQYALGVLAEDDAACERQIDGVASRLADLAEYDPALAEVAELLGSVQAGIVRGRLQPCAACATVDLDPSRLAEVERPHGCGDGVMPTSYRAQPAELPGLLHRLAGCAWPQLDESADLAALEAKLAGRVRPAYLKLAEKARLPAAPQCTPGIWARR